MVRELFENIFTCDTFSLRVENLITITATFAGCGIGPFRFSAGLQLDFSGDMPVIFVFLSLFIDPEKSFENLFKLFDPKDPNADDADTAGGEVDYAAVPSSDSGGGSREGENGKFKIELKNPIEEMVKGLKRFIRPDGKLSMSIVGYFLDLQVAPFAKSVNDITLGIATSTIEEFNIGIEGIPVLRRIPAGFFVEASINLLYMAAAPFRPIIKIIDSCTGIMSEDSPMAQFAANATAPFKFLERFPIRVSFEILEAGFSFGIGLAFDFGDSFQLVPTVGFEMIGFSLSMVIGAEAPSFALSGELAINLQVDPPFEMLKGIFKDAPWLHRLIGEGLDKPTVITGSGFLSLSITPLGVEFEIASAFTLKNKEDVMWVNPFLMMPRVAIVFPVAFTLKMKIQMCITAVTAAIGGTAAAATGVGILATIATYANVIQVGTATHVLSSNP
jgi:hypothetical protein